MRLSPVTSKDELRTLPKAPVSNQEEVESGVRREEHTHEREDGVAGKLPKEPSKNDEAEGVDEGVQVDLPCFPEESA